MKFPAIHRSSFYRDPAESVKLAGETSCKGCAHEVKVDLNGSAYQVCDVKGRRYGRRCRFFRANAQRET